MRNLLNPKWLLIIHSLPAVAIIVSYVGMFQLIRSELRPDALNAWYVFSGVFLVLSVGHLAYTIWAIRKKTLLNQRYGFIVVASYTCFLYAYFNNLELLFDSNLPEWLSAEQMPFYLSTALMPSIFHALFVLVKAYTKELANTKAWQNLLPALAIPLVWYICFQIGLPTWQPLETQFGEHVLIILFVITTLAFLFLILRTVYILLSKMENTSLVFVQIWTVVFAIVCPTLGLIINNGESEWGIDPFGQNVIGDFSNPWYFIIAIVNGLALLFSHVNSLKVRLILFAIKSISLSYVAYFFLILLPFLPLSVLLIIAVGLGLLMLSPTVLMLLQVRSLLKDFDHLKTHFGAKKLRIILTAGMLTLPMMITLNYSQDRIVLQRALTYVFENPAEDPGHVRPYALKRALKNIRQQQKRGGFIINGSTPVLTPFYNRLVMDNLTLPHYKIDDLEEVYFGKSQRLNRFRGSPSATNRSHESVNITHFETSSFRTKDKYIESTLTLEISNQSRDDLSEFVTKFELPAGTWIKNYHLWIGDRKEPGILAEKKAATWLYQQIVSTPKDPGILYYSGSHQVILRIYPFEDGQTRKTEITFIHKDPIRLQLDGQSIDIGKGQKTFEDAPFITNSAAYFNAGAKSKLPMVIRKPYYHFVLDFSHRASDQGSWYLQKMKALGKQNPELLEGAMVSQVNSHVQSTMYDPKALQGYDFKGGFFLEKAIKNILIGSYLNGTDTYPVIVVLSPDYLSAVFTKNLADYSQTFLEQPYFYSLMPSGDISQRSFKQDPQGTAKPITSLDIAPVPVRKWKSPSGSSFYLSNDSLSSVISLKVGQSDEEQINGNWKAGLEAYGKWLNFRMASEDPQREWLELVRSSFEHQVMNPTTAFMALENESQKVMLKRKQDQMLRGQNSLEPGDNIRLMSEPEWLLLLFMLPIAFFIRRLKS